MATPERVTGPINLGNAGEFSMRELAEVVIDLTGSASPIEHRPLPTDDPRQRQPNLEAASQTLGWSPKVDLRTGLTRTIAYFDQLLTAGDRTTKDRPKVAGAPNRHTPDRLAAQPSDEGSTFRSNLSACSFGRPGRRLTRLTAVEGAG